ncbi:hypothetical protein MnBA_37110 [Marinobacterium sp. BA1]
MTFTLYVYRFIWMFGIFILLLLDKMRPNYDDKKKTGAGNYGGGYELSGFSTGAR